MRTFLTILVGLVLIVVLVPVAQFSSMAMTNTDMETASPSGWALGFLISLVMVLAVVRAVSKYRLVPRESLVLIYCMLTIAVPVMNIGLVRPLFLSMRAVQLHFVSNNVDTYRTAYEAEKPRWFPVVPTLEGLAWNKADRLMRFLRDEGTVGRREGARRDLLLALALEAKQAGRADTNAAAVPPECVARIRSLIEKLGADEVLAVRETIENDKVLKPLVASMGLSDVLAARLEQETAASAAAADRLATSLMAVDEHSATYATSIYQRATWGMRQRYDQDRARLTPDQALALDAGVAAFTNALPSLRADVTALSQTDYARVRTARADAHLKSFKEMDEAELARVRTSFVLRGQKAERTAYMSQRGKDGEPNEDLASLERSMWADPVEARSVESASVTEKTVLTAQKLPWHLFLMPMVMWGALVLAVFVFLMCLAEWLRRKWVDRENLAFPVVEIVDSVIRHDYALEEAEDVLSPKPREGMFNAVFWAGVAVGGVFILVEAAGNYKLMNEVKVVTLNMSEKIFIAGIWKNLDRMVFVLSPILVGILYLVSLEISLSVWVIFLLMKVAFALMKGDRYIIDPLYTGWGGGRHYPFMSEQLLGAALCFAVILLYKAWQSSRRESEASRLHHVEHPYVPPRVTTAGMIAMPLCIGWLLWDFGLTNIPFLLLFGGVCILFTIAAARAKAETGLHTQHASYEFTKLPIVFGMSGFTGAKVFAMFSAIVFLPFTLLFRLLPQQLENMELARRNRVRYGEVALASILAFVVALGVGMASFLILAYYRGSGVYGAGAQQANVTTEGVVHYSMWVSHFLGEKGLDKWTEMHGIRIAFILVGVGIFALLSFLRARVMGFPLHPVGYLVILLSVMLDASSPYIRTAPGIDLKDVTWIWGSALTAWLVKKLVIKYGGMRTYRHTKPFFIGLVAGAFLLVFVINVVDFAASAKAQRPGTTLTPFLKTFHENPAYTPGVY
jgi:hypothetical protein